MSFKSANESTILYPGLEFAPLAAFPIFKLDASSSVIYNLYGRNHGVILASAKAEIRHVFGDTFLCQAGPPVI